MSPGAGAHEAGGHHLQPFEEPSLVQRLAMHQTPRAVALLAARLPAVVLLDDEPFRKPPRTDASPGGPWFARTGRRRVEPRHRYAGQVPELVCKPRLDHFIEFFRPCVQAADDRRVPRQVDERAGAVRRDDLTLAKLSVGATAHGSTSRPVGSLMYRSTSGSTSRSDRFARNLRWCADSNSVSSISRSSGRPCFISYC